MSVLICDKIAKKIVARSQILKKCFVNNGICDLHIEESAFVHDGEYSYTNLEADVNGFLFDVNRELSIFGITVPTCEGIKFRVDNDLLVFLYDQKNVVADDAVIEKIRINEWIIEE